MDQEVGVTPYQWVGRESTRPGVCGLRFHTGIPNVKLGKLRVAMTGFLTMPDGEKGRELCGLGRSPNSSLMTMVGVVNEVVMWSNGTKCNGAQI